MLRSADFYHHARTLYLIENRFKPNFRANKNSARMTALESEPSVLGRLKPLTTAKTGNFCPSPNMLLLQKVTGKAHCKSCRHFFTLGSNVLSEFTGIKGFSSWFQGWVPPSSTQGGSQVLPCVLYIIAAHQQPALQICSCSLHPQGNQKA